jgi:DNA modification methylase
MMAPLWEADQMARYALLYGDNLELLRNPKFIKEGSVDLCYIDPPFNSKRRYNQIYNNVGREDPAQAQAFVDIHTWNDHARSCYQEIITNYENRFTEQTIELVKGLRNVLKEENPLFAYLVGMTARIVEIHRVLKPNGSFYLHCDPTASHYLKIICDSVFIGAGGNFTNEIVWCYELGGRISKKAFGRRHDTLLFYVKGENYTFNWDQVLSDWSEKGKAKFRHQDDKGRYRLIGRFLNGSPIKGHRDVSPEWETTHPELVQRWYLKKGKMQVDYWNISPINQVAKERVGYPTQKPEALLDRIIRASSNEGDLVLDAYCGCGTTIAVAQRRHRRWIGMDITSQAIATVLNRLEYQFPGIDLSTIYQDGKPRDVESAKRLAHKQDDRLRKEFEKWAILEYCNQKAVIHEKKGGDKGIDGVTYILSGTSETEKMVLQAKSGAVTRGDVAKLLGDMGDAKLAALITLEEPSKGMREKAKSAGSYTHELTGRTCDRIRIVTVKDMLENKKTLDLPQSVEALISALRNTETKQLKLDFQAANLEEQERKKPTSIQKDQLQKRRLAQAD